MDPFTYYIYTVLYNTESIYGLVHFVSFRRPRGEVGWGRGFADLFYSYYCFRDAPLLSGKKKGLLLVYRNHFVTVV